MRLLPLLLSVLALTSPTLTQARTATVPASAVHLCINLHDEDAAQAVAKVRALGFSCYRKDATGAPIESALAAAGLKADLIVSGDPSPTGQVAKISALARAHPGSVEFVEGPNEVNNHATSYGGSIDTTGGDQTRRSAIRLFMRDLVSTVRRDPNLANVPVLAHTDIHASWAPADSANAHAYDGSTDSWPDYWPAQVSKEMSSAMPGKPQALTEFGVRHADRQPYLVPQWIAAALEAGIDRVWLYELRDERNDPYGLYAADWTPKPAAAVLAELNWLLADTGRGGAAVTPLKAVIADPAVNSVMIAKSDGSYVHLLWRSWPDGKVHPLQWSYDRAATVHAMLWPHSSGLWSSDSVSWSKAAGQPSDWTSYTDGVLVLTVRPQGAV